MRKAQIVISFLTVLFATALFANEQTRLAYLVSDQRIPYWNIMWGGIQHQAKQQGIEVEVWSADNSIKKELENTLQVIKSKVDGIILSPTNSSSAVTVLKFAKQAGIPVVIADIGTQGGDYVSYIESDNYQGAYQLGNILGQALADKTWLEGRVGIVAIPQARQNGKDRTRGFLKALDEWEIKAGGIRQQKDFSYIETYRLASDLISEEPDLRALWLQGSDRYKAALAAIEDAGKVGEILLISFDAEPEFLEMIKSQALVGAGMQQPHLMGERAVQSLQDFLNGHAVAKNQKIEVLAVSENNIDALMLTIKHNVLGLSVSEE
jgi:simple sugar transport system substrate-binding protein/ribose transport system substrate-binding protein